MVSKIPGDDVKDKATRTIDLLSLRRNRDSESACTKTAIISQIVML